MEKQETYHYKKHKKDLTLSKSKHPHLFAAVSALSDKNYCIIKCKEDGLLRFLKADTLERYDSKDKELFNELGVLLCNWLQAYMMNIFQMGRVFVPLKEELTEGSVQAPIFISQDWYKNTNRALILIQGTGSVRAGCWARSVCIKDNLDLGSMIPDIEFAIKNGFSVLVMNPNYDEDEYKNKVDDLVEPMIKHSNYVWNNFIEDGKCPAQELFIVAHSAGGSCAQDIILEHQETMVNRVSALAFTDPCYGIFYEDLNKDAKIWADENIIVYIGSSEPLDTLLNDKSSSSSNLREVSAGHEEHVYTTGCARKSYLDWFINKSQTIDRK